MANIDTFLGMLENGTDNALLRYSLGNAYFAENNYEKSAEHFKLAVEHDPAYSAAWKLLGRCYMEMARYAEAVEALQQGLTVASEKGDKQAEKEMGVFLRRAQKKLDA